MVTFDGRIDILLLLTDVAEVVLNRCITTIKKHNGTYVKKHYYEFLDDFHSLKWKRDPVDSK